jgi:hypothetical protein
MKMETFKQMIDAINWDPFNPNNGYALGLSAQKTANGIRLGHSGSFPGMLSWVKVDVPTGIGITLAMNSMDGNRDYYWNLAFATIGNAVRGMSPSPIAPPGLPVPPPLSPYPVPDQWANICGKYQSLFGNYWIQPDQNGNLNLNASLYTLTMLPIYQNARQVGFRLGSNGPYSSLKGELLSFYLKADGTVDYVMLSNSNRWMRVGNLKASSDLLRIKHM